MLVRLAAKKLQLCIRDHADLEWSLTQSIVARAVGVIIRPAVAVAGIKAFGDSQHRIRIIAVVGKHGHAVDAATGRQHPGRGQQADTGFQTHQIIKTGWHPTRAGGIGAKAEGREPEPDGHRRTGTGAATDVRGVKAVFAGAIRRACAVQASGKLIEIGLADRNRTSCNKLMHHLRRMRGRISKLRTGRRGGDAGQVDIVLNRKRDTPERVVFGIFIGQRIDKRRLFVLCQQMNKDVAISVAGSGCADRLHQRARCQVAACVGGAQAADTHVDAGHNRDSLQEASIINRAWPARTGSPA